MVSKEKAAVKQTKEITRKPDELTRVSVERKAKERMREAWQRQLATELRQEWECTV